MTRYTCARCGSDDIKQEVSFMVNPNTYNGEILDMNDAYWEDFFHCNVCEDECPVDEHEDEDDEEESS